MFYDPVLELNLPLLEQHLEEVKDKKEGDGLSSLEERLKKLQSKKKAGAD